MKKHLFTLLAALLLPAMALLAQQSIHLTEPPPPTDDGVKFYQIYLEKPAQAIKNLQYKDGTPLNGELSEDGKRVIISNYDKRAGISVEVTYTDGQTEEIKRSPCFVDPVVPL
ncbi:hypothetical protein C7N43_04265 [Sphingobacteriales bacterium UPWRP_1]|nr:hypothetical protein B6N25_04810 [Sphingobacteriales bacterium TSM_CSS]PSJ78281.1 hypothetical protein C7N43_04265 [Sphingobacteriales bacterium UPWRP_1]